MNIPDNKDDFVNSIVVINDESQIDKSFPLDFAFYVLIDSNGHCTVLANEGKIVCSL